MNLEILGEVFFKEKNLASSKTLKIWNKKSEGPKKTELAKPYTKIEAKVGTKPDPVPKIANKKNEIWDINEIQELPISKNDTRIRPDFEVY